MVHTQQKQNRKYKCLGRGERLNQGNELASRSRRKPESSWIQQKISKKIRKQTKRNGNKLKKLQDFLRNGEK